MVKEWGKKTSICICDQCGKEFSRRTADVRRSVREGMKQFHTQSCSTRWLNEHATDNMKRAAGERLAAYRGHSQSDEFTPFRYFHHSIRRRELKGGKYEGGILTLEDLREIWNHQKGVCPYTGITMVLPVKMYDPWPPDVSVHLRPSIDRIDSSKGYTRDNVQFVSQMSNYAKNKHSHEEMVAFCRIVADHWGGREEVRTS